jgi:hypothetical protein
MINLIREGIRNVAHNAGSGNLQKRRRWLAKPGIISASKAPLLSMLW